MGAVLSCTSLFSSPVEAIKISATSADWSDFLNMGTDVVGGLVGGDVGSQIQNSGNLVDDINDAAKQGSVGGIMQATTSNAGNMLGGQLGSQVQSAGTTSA